MRTLYYALLCFITLSHHALCAAAEKENIDPVTSYAACIAGSGAGAGAGAASEAAGPMESRAAALPAMINAANDIDDYTQAIKYFEDYVADIGGRDKIPAQFADILQHAALAYLSLGNPALAGSIYEEYFSLIGGTPSVPAAAISSIIYAAMAHSQNHHYPRSLELNHEYVRVIGGIEAITLENTGALINIAQLYARNNLSELSLKTYSRYFQLIGGVDKVPADHSFTLTEAALECLRHNDLDSVSTLYYEYVKREPDFKSSVLPYIAHYYYKTKRYQAALEECNAYFKGIGGLDKVPEELSWIIPESIAARHLIKIELEGRAKIDRAPIGKSPLSMR